jgi:hypothetical protein
MTVAQPAAIPVARITHKAAVSIRSSLNNSDANVAASRNRGHKKNLPGRSRDGA